MAPLGGKKGAWEGVEGGGGAEGRRKGCDRGTLAQSSLAGRAGPGRAKLAGKVVHIMMRA